MVAASKAKEKTVTEHQKAVIGALLNDADALTKKVISAYSPIVTYNVNMQNLGRFNSDHVEAAAVFLGFKVRADTKKLYKNLKILRDRVILKIESLFESNCLECGETYSNKLSDTPLMVCHLCLQGSHNCEKVRDKLKVSPRPSGTVWLCSGCYEKNDLTLMPKYNESAAQQENAIEEEHEDNLEEEGDRVSPRRDRYNLHDSQGMICEAYKRRECKHGLTGKRLINGKPCPDRHPPRCFRWCKHGENKRFGCDKGSECPYFHPKLCKDSVLKRFCPNRDCTFHHLKHTRRPKDQPHAPPRRETPKQPPKQPFDPKFSSLPRGSAIPPRFRWDSVSTLNGGNYAPRVDKKTKPDTRPRERKLSTKSVANDQTNAFLVQFLENMKEGIVLQLSEKMAEFQDAIPLMIRDQLQTEMNRPSAPPPAPLYPLPLQTMPLSRPPTAPPQLPLQAQGFLTQYPGCSY